MTALGALIAFVGLVLVGGYLWYAGLITKRNKAREALSGIDVQLRKRFDLIPNILKIASRFMEHEKELLGEVTALRARAMQSSSVGRSPRKARISQRSRARGRSFARMDVATQRASSEGTESA